jgi:hypothetical protein
MQHEDTSESSQKYSGGDQSCGQDEKKGHSGGPVVRRGSFSATIHIVVSLLNLVLQEGCSKVSGCS